MAAGRASPHCSASPVARSVAHSPTPRQAVPGDCGDLHASVSTGPRDRYHPLAFLHSDASLARPSSAAAPDARIAPPHRPPKRLQSSRRPPTTLPLAHAAVISPITPVRLSLVRRLPPRRPAVTRAPPPA